MSDYGNPPLAPAPRRRTWPLWIVVGVLAFVLVILGAAISYFVIRPGPDDPGVRADRLRDTDPRGFYACQYYEMWTDGAIPATAGWTKVRSEAAQATTAAIRSAADPRTLHAACINAGLTMDPYVAPPGY